MTESLAIMELKHYFLINSKKWHMHFIIIVVVKIMLIDLVR